LLMRLRGRGCRHCSRNDKNCGDACVPLEHDITSYVVRKSTPEMACGFRLRRGRGLHGAYMACDKFADYLLRTARSTVSYLVGTCTGRSAGFSPFRMRSTYDVDRRTISPASGP